MNDITTKYTDLEYSSFDLHFAEFLFKLDSSDNHVIYISAALLCKALREGHTCVNLKDYAETPCVLSDDHPVAHFPSLEQWREALLSSTVAGQPGDYCPLILDSNLLYLYRYYNYETTLANALLSRTEGNNLPDINSCKTFIDNIFNANTGEVDYQRIAALAALSNKCTIISGGPGTGKTTTVAKIIALLMMVHGTHLRIALAAPTGKAAARLSSSISSIIPGLPCPDEIKNAIPDKATTLHRLLGVTSFSPEFIHDDSNQLPYDIVIIDEASMIDLALMSKCIAALKPQCKLILLGDKDQLSSVEAGSVLGDICDTGTFHSFTKDFYDYLKVFDPDLPPPEKNEPGFANCIVSLNKSYRFDNSSGIGMLSRAINDGDAERAIDILNDSNYNDCTFNQISPESDLSLMLNSYIREYFSPLLKSDDPLASLQLLDRFRILCAVRKGPFGINALNERIASILLKRNPDSRKEYHGKPLIITNNNYSLDIFNGDTAVLMQDSSDKNNLKAAFRTFDNNIRYVPFRQIASWESAYALTVHKSQGSEFDSVLLILPIVSSPVLTRELLYTAVTRAKKKVEIWGTAQVLKSCIGSRIVRSSGLREKLWKR